MNGHGQRPFEFSVAVVIVFGSDDLPAVVPPSVVANGHLAGISLLTEDDTFEALDGLAKGHSPEP